MWVLLCQAFRLRHLGKTSVFMEPSEREALLYHTPHHPLNPDGRCALWLLVQYPLPLCLTLLLLQTQGRHQSAPLASVRQDWIRSASSGKLFNLPCNLAIFSLLDAILKCQTSKCCFQNGSDLDVTGCLGVGRPGGGGGTGAFW